jgi:hypothetical protein
LLFVEFLSDGKAAVQAAIAGENFPTSPHGDGTDQRVAVTDETYPSRRTIGPFEIQLV